MKKIIYAILGVMFLLPVVVKADMGPPEIKPYKIVPKVSGPVTYYDNNFNVAGTATVTEIQVSYEVIHNGEAYAMGWNDGIDGYVKLSDFQAVDAPKGTKSEAKYSAKVFATEGLDVYAGPSYSNEKVGTLSYLDDVAADSIGDVWAYVEKGNIKGYVNVVEGTLGILTKGKKINIETNEEVTEYYVLDTWSSSKVMIKDGESYKKVLVGDQIASTTKTTQKECTVYSNASESQTVIGTIPAGTSINISYYFGKQAGDYYVSTDSIKGWVKYEGFNSGAVNYCFDTDNSLQFQDGQKVLFKAVDEDTKEESKGTELTPKTIIIVSICIGIIVVLTAIVTLVLVNKKNKME